jgi:signal transduction histidine kinase
VLRNVLLANALVLYAYRIDAVQRPVLGAACVLAMTVWTPLSSWLMADPRRRTPWWLGLDLALALGLLLLSPVVKGAGFEATLPGFWVVGALMAWAVRYRWPGGLLAGAALATADLAVRRDITQANAGNVFLLVLGGAIVGSMAESLHRMALERDRAEREAAAAAERTRLARAVHDGVLQVLGLVQRRGRDEPALADLGRLAGEQEVALRALIRRQDSVAPSAGASADLVTALTAYAARPGVSVVDPGAPVEVAAPVATELAAAVGACLDNVARHAPGASAWVLLEDEVDRVVVTVRDDGPGIPAGRLEEAETEGRLGVTGSIRGRVADLGGTAEVVSDGSGTTWTLAVPRPPAG